MPKVIITKNDQGKLAGLSDADERAYARFRERISALTADESLSFSWVEPRSGPYHKRHFVMLNKLFDAQEQFENVDHFRKWLEIGAGYCKFVPGPKGRMVAMPDSISYERLDQKEFEPIHEAVFRFARTQYATRFLWPHLSDEQGLEMVMSVLMEFGV